MTTVRNINLLILETANHLYEEVGEVNMFDLIDEIEQLHGERVDVTNVNMNENELCFIQFRHKDKEYNLRFYMQ